MNTSWLPGALLALTLLLPALPAQAGRPLVTEDAGMLGGGECELESVAARERARDVPTVRSASAQVGCGIGWRSQVALFAGRSSSEGVRTEDVALVGKSALIELTDDKPGVVLAWALGASRERGASFKHESSELKAVYTHPLGDWLLHGNLGWTRSEADKLNTTIWSVAAERTGLGPFDLMGEVFGDDRGDPWLNAGLRLTAIAERLFIDASYGRQMNSGRARLMTLGLKFTF